MSRQFSIPTILRMVPNELLQEFFVTLGHSEFDPCWAELGKRELDPMLDYITDLPASQASQIDLELQAVYELSCQSGMTAITEAAKIHGVSDLALNMPQEMSVHGRTMWMRLRYSQVFNTAQLLHEVDHLSWWRKRNDLPAKAPDVSPDAIERLEHEISCLLKDQGRGRLCTVETYRRGAVHYFFAYPDDYSETAHKHDDVGDLVPVVIHKTMQVVFAYDQGAGSLETYAKLPKRMKERMENCFTACILHESLSDQSPGNDDRMYVLEIGESTQFKFPYDFDKGETRWSVITYGNWPYYPITRTDDFDTYEEAVTYLKGTAPLTPRVSLDGKCPEPVPSWDEFQDWLREQGLPSMSY